MLALAVTKLPEGPAWAYERLGVPPLHQAVFPIGLGLCAVVAFISFGSLRTTCRINSRATATMPSLDLKFSSSLTCVTPG